MNSLRADHTATLLPNGNVLVAAGSEWSYTQLSTAETYNPATETWTPTGSLAAERAYHTATLLSNGKVLIAGGWDAGSVLPNAELFVDAAPITLTGVEMLPTGAFQFTFTNTPDVNFSALVATNPMLPLTNWPVLGSVSEILPGQYQFTDPQATNSSQRFYRIQSN